MCLIFVFVCEQRSAYDMRISDCSSDVCSSDLVGASYQTISTPAGAGVPSEALSVVLWPELMFTSACTCGVAGASPTVTVTTLASAGRFSQTPVPSTVTDRKSVVEGKSVSVRVDLGGRRIIKKKNKKKR